MQNKDVTFKKIEHSEVIGFLLDNKELMRRIGNDEFHYFLHKSVFGKKTVFRKESSTDEWHKHTEMDMNNFFKGNWYVLIKEVTDVSVR